MLPPNSPSSSRGWLCTGGPAGCSGQTGPPTGRRGSSLHQCPHSSGGLQKKNPQIIKKIKKQKIPDPMGYIGSGIHSFERLISSQATGVELCSAFHHVSLCRPTSSLAALVSYIFFYLPLQPSISCFPSHTFLPPPLRLTGQRPPETLFNPPAGSIRMRIFALVASPCFHLVFFRATFLIFDTVFSTVHLCL